MKWQQNKSLTNEQVIEVANKYNTSYLATRILLNRDKNEEFARVFFKDTHEAINTPELLHKGQEVANIISENIKNGNDIFIHADYDSDGINGGFLMEDVLTAIANYIGSTSYIKTFYPTREYGYGLSFFFAEKIIEHKKENPKKNVLVITVDNGVAQIDQIQMLLENDINVVVTDHHESKEKIPKCLICDPHNKHEEQDMYKDLCGTAVAFKVCELVQKNFGFHDMYKYIGNLAIATITDVMPLSSENMAFIKYGLEFLNSENCPIGIQAMKEFLGIKKINASHIAWEIGPRLNSCGRMGKTSLGAELLQATDYHKATDIVNEIELLNDERKEITKEATKKINKMNFDDSLVCIIELDVPEGIVGIVAGKAVEKFKKPCIVVTEKEGICSGSARSIPGVNLQTIFSNEAKKGNLINFGGHKEAAGLSYKKENEENLINSINETLSNLFEEMKIDQMNAEDEILRIDECIKIKDLNKYVFDEVNVLPYNNTDFKKPVFAMTDCKVIDFAETKTNPDNIWLTLQQDRQKVKLWCQNMSKIYKEIGCPSKIHIAGHLEKNFMECGREYILKVVDLMDAS